MKADAVNNEIFLEIERLYRNYQAYVVKLSLLKPRISTVQGYISLQGQHHGSHIEELGIQRAELSEKVDMVRKCLRAMTKDERRFIELRYFDGFTMQTVEREMHWSRRQLYRLRTSVLSKSAWLLGFLNKV